MRLRELFNITEERKPTAVVELEKDLKDPLSYKAIGDMMKTIARDNRITPHKLHVEFCKHHDDLTPDDWVHGKKSLKSGKNNK